MQNKLKTEIPEEQTGYRPGKRTSDQILKLNQLPEKSWEVGTDVYLCFIDYRKAFDTVVHEVIWTAKEKMGFLYHIIDLIKILYVSHKAAGRTTHGTTEWFEIGQSVRQGFLIIF